MGKLWSKLASLMLTITLLAGLTAGFPIGAAAAEPPVESLPPAEQPAEEAADPAEEPAEAPDEEPGDESAPAREEEAPREEQVYTDGSSTPTDISAGAAPFDVEEAVNSAEAIGQEENDIYKMLGMDASIPPDTSSNQVRAKGAPYGQKHTITFSELLVGGHSASNATPDGYLYGHGSGQNALLNRQVAQKKQIYRNDDANGANRRAFNFNLDTTSGESTVAFEGDFTGSGRKSQVAMLSYWNNSSMELWVGNAADLASKELDMYKLDSYTPASGYPSNYRLGFYWAQKDLHLKTGDVNGDGLDEIILLLPNYPGTDTTSADKSRLLIYSLTGANWKNGSHWRKIYDNTFDIGFGDNFTTGSSTRTTTTRCHSLAVGDLDGDGKADIALSGSEQKVLYYNSSSSYCSGDSARASLSVLLSGESTATSYVPKTTKTYNYSSESGGNLYGSNALMPLPTLENVDPADQLGSKSPLMFPAGLGVDISEADGAAGNELLLGFNLFATIKDGSAKRSSQSLGYRAHMMQWQAADSTLVPANNAASLALNVGELHRFTDGNAKYNDKTLDQLINAFLGGNTPESYDQGAVRLTAARMAGPQSKPSIIVGNNRHDFGTEIYSLVPSHDNVTWQHSYYPLPNSGVFYTLRPAIMNSLDSGNTVPSYGYMIHYNCGGYDHVEFISARNTPNPNETGNNVVNRLHTGKMNKMGCSFACLPDTDMDTVILEFEGYDYIYSDPVILAALAAPPYVGDIARTAGADYVEACTTTFQMLTSTETATSQSNTNSLGAYAAAEAEIGCLFASVVVETEVEYKHTWTTELAEAVTTSLLDSFGADEHDSVLMLVYPMDMYTYTMTYPEDSNASNAGDCTYTVYTPYLPAHETVPMSRYAKMREMYPDLLPDVEKEIFTHEVGYPDTYYSSVEYLPSDALASNVYNAATTGSDGPSLEITTSETRTTSSSNEVDFKIGAGAKAGITNSSVQATAGITYGNETTKGKSVTETSGTSFSSTLKGNIYHGSSYYPFSRQMVTYNYRGVANFPVITYAVQMRRGAQTTPYLPEDIWIDESRTTNNQITICWTPSREDINPGPNSNIHYGVFQKLSEEGKYTDLTASADAIKYSSLENAYSFTHTKLSASRSYNYVVRTMRKSNVNNVWGPDSETITSTTNPNSGTFGFTIQPQNTTITPGGDLQQLTAEFKGGDGYDISYSWESLADAGWGPLSNSTGIYSGVDTPTLTFVTPRAGQAGSFRLLVTLKTGGDVVKQFVSDVAEVDYKKNRSTLSFTSLPNPEAGDTSITVSAKVAKADSAATATLDGSIAFSLTSPTGSLTVMSVDLKGSDTATHTFDLLQQGLYTLDATYSGNDCYALCHADTVRFSNDSSQGNTHFTTDYNPGTGTYGELSTPIGVKVHVGGGLWLSGEPSLKVYRYNDNGTLNSTPESGWVTPDNQINYLDVGKIRVEIRHGNAAEPIYRDVVVQPRNVEYTIDNVTRYLPSQVPSKADLNIRLTSGALVGSDSLGYNNGNLAVYDAEDNVVELGSSTPAGEYKIAPAALPKKNNRYNVTLKSGNYTVVRGVATHALQYGPLPGTEEQGTVKVVQPASYTSGNPLAHGSNVLLVAEPAEGYEFKQWHDSKNSGTPSTKNGKDYYEISSLTVDCDVWAEFTRAVHIDDITISVAGGPPFAPGAAFGFSAKVTGSVEGSGVVWSLRGAHSGDTSINPDTGILDVSIRESSNMLIVVATSKVLPSFTKEYAVPLKHDGIYLNLTYNNEVMTELTLSKNEARPLTLAANGTITEAAPVTGNKNIVTAELNSAAQTLTLAGKAVGSTVVTVTAKVNGFPLTRQLSVRVVDDADIEVTLSKTSLDLVKGKAHKLGVSYAPSKMPYAELIWHSSNEKVATVDQSGKITALAPGRTTVSLEAIPLGSEQKAIRRACNVTVTVPASSVKLQTNYGSALPKTITLAMEGSLNNYQAVPLSMQLKAAVAPVDTTDTLTWHSSNDAIVEVDPAGNVTGGRPGTATITAKLGKKSAKCTVKVIATVPDKAITLDKSTAELMVKGSLSLKASVAKRLIEEESYSVSTKLKWTSSDSKVATVSSSGKVTGVGIGSTAITASSQENPSIRVSCTVKVAAPVTSVRFTQKDFTITTSTTETPSTAVIGLSFNGGAPVSSELAAMKLTLSDTEALRFTGENALDEGKSFLLNDPNELVTLLAAETLPAGKTKHTVTLTAATTHERYRKAIAPPKLKITVTSDSLVPVSGPPVLTNAKKAPGCGTYHPEHKNLALAVGRSFTPAVSVGPKEASDKNISWAISAEYEMTSMPGISFSENPAFYVDFDPATGKVTAREESDLGSVIFTPTIITVTGTASNGESLSYSFRTIRRATKVVVRSSTGASSATVNTGEGLLLWAAVFPDNATANQMGSDNVTWTSTNEDVATVSNGYVMAGTKGGSTIIKATANDDSKKYGSFRVTVRQSLMDAVITNAPMKGLGIGEIGLHQGSTLKLKARLNAANTVVNNKLVSIHPQPGNKKVSWRVVPGSELDLNGNAAPGTVVSLNPKTGAVKGLAAGTVRIQLVPNGYDPESTSFSEITVWRKDGSGFIDEKFSSTVQLSVTASAKTVKIDQKNFSVYGDREQLLFLNATTNPGLTTLSGGKDVLVWRMPKATGLSFYSIDIGSVKEDIMVKGVPMVQYTAPADTPTVVLKAANVTKDTSFKLTVEAQGSTKPRTHSITIKVTADEKKAPELESVSLKKSATWLQVGKTEKLAAVITPKKPGNPNLSWSLTAYTPSGARLPASEAHKVATVDTSGKVKATGNGYAVVSVKSMDGHYQASCRVYCLARN